MLRMCQQNCIVSAAQFTTSAFKVLRHKVSRELCYTEQRAVLSNLSRGNLFDSIPREASQEVDRTLARDARRLLGAQRFEMKSLRTFPPLESLHNQNTPNEMERKRPVDHREEKTLKTPQKKQRNEPKLLTRSGFKCRSVSVIV